MNTSSILRMIGALGSAVGGIGGSFGRPSSATSLPPASSPSLDQLTLNPQVMGESPRIPYDFGQGQDMAAQQTMPPNLPPGQNADQAAAGSSGGKEKTWQEHVMDFGKAVLAAGKAGSAVQNSPLAQQMFQENSQRQMIVNQIQQGKIEEFRRKDLSSQILEKYGLL